MLRQHKNALATTKKGNMSIAEYVSKIRALGDELTNTGKTIDNDELVSYILAGLDEEYNPVVTSLVVGGGGYRRRCFRPAACV